MDDKHAYHHHSQGHHQDHDHDQEHDDHDHETGTAEYLRLGLMGIIVVASLTGGGAHSWLVTGSHSPEP